MSARLDIYYCDNCSNTTTESEHVHITNRMRYNPAFGNFVGEPMQFCCDCYRMVQGECDIIDRWSSRSWLS